MGGSPRAADLWSGLVLAAFGLWIVSEAWGWRFIGRDGPGAGFFPMWHGVGILVLSLVLAARSFGKSEGEPTNWQGIVVGLGVWAVFVFAIALLRTLGFAFVLFAFTLFVVSAVYRRSLRTGAVVAVLNVAAFYAAFSFGLGVRLPAGPWGF